MGTFEFFSRSAWREVEGHYDNTFQGKFKRESKILNRLHVIIEYGTYDGSVEYADEEDNDAGKVRVETGDWNKIKKFKTNFRIFPYKCA